MRPRPSPFTLGGWQLARSQSQLWRKELKIEELLLEEKEEGEAKIVQGFEKVVYFCPDGTCTIVVPILHGMGWNIVYQFRYLNCYLRIIPLIVLIDNAMVKIPS